MAPQCCTGARDHGAVSSPDTALFSDAHLQHIMRWGSYSYMHIFSSCFLIVFIIGNPTAKVKEIKVVIMVWHCEQGTKCWEPVLK